MDSGKIRVRLKKWYQKSKRPLPWRESKSPYFVWVSEVMLQQTQVNTVIPYYQRFIARFPDVRGLAEADLQDVLKIWEGLGYYARARNLHKAAKVVLELHGGQVPGTWDKFRYLPGVGDYIASAVLSIAFGRPYPVVDGNVKRVLARLTAMDLPVNQSSSYRNFHQAAVELLDHDDPGEFNQAVMELGALVCKPGKPDCQACPLQSCCLALDRNQVAMYPKTLQRPKTPLHHLAVAVILKDGKTLIVRRPEKGLLGGLWEFPTGRTGQDESPESACVRIVKEQANLKVSIQSKLTGIRHAYTHFKMKLDGPADYRWVGFDELNNYPFPKANHKFIPMLIAQHG
ncbi:MAG: A/G-specific adenine glycosylase [Desulfobacterales bacterium]|nr:A/G-specific adenine glycosylase [Desulfobacterales bacterium]